LGDSLKFWDRIFRRAVYDTTTIRRYRKMRNRYRPWKPNMPTCRPGILASRHQTRTHPPITSAGWMSNKYFSNHSAPPASSPSPPPPRRLPRPCPPRRHRTGDIHFEFDGVQRADKRRKARARRRITFPQAWRRMAMGTGTEMRRRTARRCCRACVAFLSYMYIDEKLIRIRTCTAGCSGSASSARRGKRA
jgi:hypothetical protein